MKKDINSINYGKDVFLQAICPFASTTARLHTEEDNGFDYSGYTPDGKLIPVEVKTWTSDFKTMMGRNYGNPKKFCRSCTPDRDDDLSTFRCPSQLSIEKMAYKETYDTDHRLMEISVSSTNRLTGEAFINHNPSDERYLPKWLKFQKYENSALEIIFKDGVLFFPHDMLMDAFVGYCWCREEVTNGSEKYTWQLKALIDLDKGLWFEGKTPEGILGEKGSRYV